MICRGACKRFATRMADGSPSGWVLGVGLGFCSDSSYECNWSGKLHVRDDSLLYHLDIICLIGLKEYRSLPFSSVYYICTGKMYNKRGKSPGVDVSSKCVPIHVLSRIISLMEQYIIDIHTQDLFFFWLVHFVKDNFQLLRHY